MRHVYIITVFKEKLPPDNIEAQAAFFSRGHALHAHARAVADFGDENVVLNATPLQFSDNRTFLSEVWARVKNLGKRR